MDAPSYIVSLSRVEIVEAVEHVGLESVRVAGAFFADPVRGKGMEVVSEGRVDGELISSIQDLPVKTFGGIRNNAEGLCGNSHLDKFFKEDSCSLGAFSFVARKPCKSNLMRSGNCSTCYR